MYDKTGWDPKYLYKCEFTLLIFFILSEHSENNPSQQFCANKHGLVLLLSWLCLQLTGCEEENIKIVDLFVFCCTNSACKYSFMTTSSQWTLGKYSDKKKFVN